MAHAQMDALLAPGQPTQGAGSDTRYLCDSVRMLNFAQRSDGYWLFEPIGPKIDSAKVIVFIHGYGCYNPMIYGQWIRHLVRQGNTVIYPRYQLNLVFPRPMGFAKNTAKGIRKALQYIQKSDHFPRPNLAKIIYAGHSYGGVVAADLAVNFEKYKVPKPNALFLAEPGTSKFRGGRLKSYAKMPADIKMITIVGSKDWVTGDEFGLLLHNTSPSKRVLLKQFPDKYGDTELNATHHEPYALDYAFDTGVRNYSALRAIQRAKLNSIDYYVYWRLFDALLDNVHRGSYELELFQNNTWLTNLGTWSDGKQVKSLEWMD